MSSRVSIRNDERAADDNDSDSLSAPLSAGSDPISSTAQHGVTRQTKYFWNTQKKIGEILESCLLKK